MRAGVFRPGCTRLYFVVLHSSSSASRRSLFCSPSSQKKRSCSLSEERVFSVPSERIHFSSSLFRPFPCVISARHLCISPLHLHPSSDECSSSSAASLPFSTPFSHDSADAALAYTPPPPRPQGYVSPEDRGVEDSSLEFLPEGDERKQGFLEHRKRLDEEREERLSALEKEAAEWRRQISPDDKSSLLELEQRMREERLPHLGENQLRAPTLARWSAEGTQMLSKASTSDTAAIHPSSVVSPTSVRPSSLPENPKVICRGEYDDLEDDLRTALAEADAESQDSEESGCSLDAPSISDNARGGSRGEDGQDGHISAPFSFSSPAAASASGRSSFSHQPFSRVGKESPSGEADEEETFSSSSSSSASYDEVGGGSTRDAPKREDEREKDGKRDRRRHIRLTRTQEMEMAAEKLEYYFGTPQYPQMVEEFRQKFAAELEMDEGAMGERGTNPSLENDGQEGEGSVRSGERVYSETEIRQGLANQPLDYLRSSKRLQMRLHEGPHAYDPITVLQRQGWMRFQGYAFPPSTELGKLKLDGKKGSSDGAREGGLSSRWEDIDRYVRYGDDAGATGIVRRAFLRLLGKDDPREQYMVPSPSEAAIPRKDNSLVFRVTGLDIVQRRQVRYMLTDFDYADRSTAFHVMMTYPYTDWIHAFYMVSAGVGLYWLQLHFNALDFYDEYLGLDLRQTPSAKKPFLAAFTTFVMVYFLFQPLLIASIATTRLYRIIRRRPIGPP